MTTCPLRLSSPLYVWDQTASEEQVAFDELHQRVVHKKKGGFFAIDIAQGGGTPNGLFVKFEADGLRLVRFSPDGSYFAYVCGKKLVGCMETSHPTREPSILTLKWNRADLEVLNFFWLPAVPKETDHADIAVLTTQGVEIFRLVFDQQTTKSMKSLPAAIRLGWIEPLSGMVLACIGPRTLQPFDLQSKTSKLPKFDLVIGRTQSIEVQDVVVMTIYDATYCIHADSTNGRVSLRNISNPMQGTPEHDIVIDIATDGNLVGSMRLSKVDNLLIVLCINKMEALVFDIRHRWKSAIPIVCGPSPMQPSVGSNSSTSWTDWDFVGGSYIMDRRTGVMYQLQINMDVVLQEFSQHSPQDLATVMCLLLRRTDCRQHIVQTLKRALSGQSSFDELAQGFTVVNQAYRQAIEAVSQKQPVRQGHQATISLQQLEAEVGHQSILSEKDMVAQVFHPHFLEVAGKDTAEAKKTQNGSGGNSADDFDWWRIPLPPDNAGVLTNSDGSTPVSSPYIVSVVVAYLRSLLIMQILPHKILQCFVFDICMYFQQEHTLQQLLHYHVLLDSTELVLRLKEVAVTRNSAWATQACFDMALRLQEFTMVAELLLHTRQYLDVVPFLCSHQVGSFELWRLLERIDFDSEVRADDPDILQHVISEIRIWHHEAKTSRLLDRRNLVAPNLEHCGRWMPELAPQSDSSQVQGIDVAVADS